MACHITKPEARSVPERLVLWRAMVAAEAGRFGGNPFGKTPDLRVGIDFLDAPVMALKFLFVEQRMDLGMTRPTDPDHLFDQAPVKIAFVLFVMMAGPRDEVMTGEHLFPAADSARSSHGYAPGFRRGHLRSTMA